MPSRRAFLSACAGAAATGLAGCIETRRRYSGDFMLQSSTVTNVDVETVENEPKIVSHVVDGDEKKLVIEGVVTGRNGCFDDVSGTVTADDEEEAITATVKPIRSNPERRICTQALVSVGYRATMVYRGSLDSVTVTHGGVDSGTFELDVGTPTEGDAN